MDVRSGAFGNDQTIPRIHGYKNGNKSPHLAISGVPDGTASLALIMDDPDAMAAVGRVWTHWVVWNIDPGTAEFKEGSVPDGCAEGMTDFGETGYGGPAPPDREHVYRFRLYALDCMLDLPADSAKRDLEEAMRGHVVSEALLTGRYSP